MVSDGGYGAVICGTRSSTGKLSQCSQPSSPSSLCSSLMSLIDRPGKLLYFVFNDDNLAVDIPSCVSQVLSKTSCVSSSGNNGLCGINRRATNLFTGARICTLAELIKRRVSGSRNPFKFCVYFLLWIFVVVFHLNDHGTITPFRFRAKLTSQSPGVISHQSISYSIRKTLSTS